MDYKDYQHLVFERRPHGVLLITLNRPQVLNATNDRMHWELTQVWLTIDPTTRRPGSPSSRAPDARSRPAGTSRWWRPTPPIHGDSPTRCARPPTSSTT